jgi:hypothetical protein
MSWLLLRSAIVNAGCATVCLLGLTVASCGGTNDTAGAAAPGDDGGATEPPLPPPPPPPPPKDDGGVHVPVAPRCTAARPADKLADMPAPTGFFATHPLPQLMNQGGAVLASPRVVPIFFAGDPMATALEDFVASIGCTEHWRTAVGEYGVGDAVAAPAVHLTESAPANIADADLETWLAGKIASGALEAPTKNTVYAVFYPEGTTVTLQGQQSCQTFGGYHTDLTLTGGGTAAYAVMPRCKSLGGLTGIDMVTGAASHELAEAATDPYNKEAPAYMMVDDAHEAFMYILGGENGDLCAQEQSAFYKPQGYPFTVQRTWSNRNARGGKNPCIPAATSAYFTAAPKLTDDIQLFGAQPTRGVKVAAGTSKTIDLDLYSESAGDDLHVDVIDVSGALGMGGGGSTYTLDRPTGKAGDTLKLTVTSPAGASGTEIFIIAVSGPGGMRIAWVGAVGH